LQWFVPSCSCPAPQSRAENKTAVASRTSPAKRTAKTPAYKREFLSTIKDKVFHGQHGEEGGPGYLVIDGNIAVDGSAKLRAKGTVTHNHVHAVFAMKGNNYD
jgi:hypothetical protein